MPDFGRRQRRIALAAYGLFALALLLTVAYCLVDSSVFRSSAFLLIGLSCVGAWTAGVLLHVAPADRQPWWWATATTVLFLAGLLLRAATPMTGAASYPPDVLTLAGYACLVRALVLWLRSGASQQRLELLDAALVGLGACLVTWVLQVVPALQHDNETARNVLNAVYPVTDIVVLTLCVRMALTRGTRYPAFWLFVLSMAALLTGDVVYTMSSALDSAPPPLADAPFLIAFGAFAAAGLHPSTRRLSTPALAPSQEWSRWRLLVMGVALFAPTILAAAVPAEGVADRVVRVVLVAALTGVVLRRLVQTINTYAAGEHAARDLAYRDQLTGLANREALHDRLRDELPRAASVGAPVSVLFLDLDGFKLVNDSYGHAVGDELLIAAARRISEQLRDRDFVARVGGDEFVAVAHHPETAGAEGLALRLIEVFEAPFELSVGPMFVSVSVGISRFNPADSVADAESLIREADTAMYQAKSTGRNRAVVFDASLRETVRTRIEVENGLRRAIELDEFELHYQPIVDMASGRVRGCEALLRWRHPERGLVSPATFIPIAEDSFLIVAIGRWVLQQATRDLARWRADGHTDFYVSVNVSARQLLDVGLLNDVVDALAESQVPGSALVLELTESALVVNPDEVQATLTSLRTLGIGLAVDDFGTGYSALSYLRRFPVTIVKIDRAFVSLPGVDTALVSAILAMSKALGLSVIAEGVETAEQESALLALGCRSAQGYRYGKPGAFTPDRWLAQASEKSAT
jgi:diguanylate cyclase (GGDEF)-like protein